MPGLVVVNGHGGDNHSWYALPLDRWKQDKRSYIYETWVARARQRVWTQS